MATRYDRTSILVRQGATITDLCESWDVDVHMFRSWLMFRFTQPGCRATAFDPDTGLPWLRFHPNRLLARLLEPGEQEKWWEIFKISPDHPEKDHQMRPNVSAKWEWIHSTGSGSQEKEWRALELARKHFGQTAYDAVSVGFSAVSVALWRELSYESPLDMLDDAKYEVGQLRQAFFAGMIEYGQDFFAGFSEKSPEKLAKSVSLRRRDVKNVEKRLILGYKASCAGLTAIPEGL